VWTAGNLRIQISKALNVGVGRRGDPGKTEDLEKIKDRRSGRKRRGSGINGKSHTDV
jgi:hypothetical protein